MFNADEFKQFVTKLIKEYCDDYRVHIEFSTSRDNMREKMFICYDVLDSMAPDNKSYWNVFWCEVCNEHHSDKPIHVQLLGLGESY